MHRVSSQYKTAMNKFMRDRAYIQIGVGVVSQEAQGSAYIDNELAYWSTKDSLFVNDDAVERVEYATLEQNYLKADGNMLFMGEDSTYYFYENGITTTNIRESIKISFDNTYDIKGLTLIFGEFYPTSFKVTTSNGTVFNYTNNSKKFVTTNVLGEISYLIITPIKMVGGNQRLRLNSVMMGVGLTFGNEDISKASYKEYISLISEEISSNNLSFTVLDANNIYNVDSTDSFINYLQSGQQVKISMGQTLEDNTVEWIQIGTLNLQEWSSTRGQMKLAAVDKFAQMDDDYTDGYKIYTRTAYAEAESILEDMGLEPDEYQIDDYLQDINLTNPMPESTHKECLQLLANACRCVCYQDSKGKIIIKSSFELTVDPTELTVSDNGHARWSKPNNVRIGASVHYGDMSQDFTPADATFKFTPTETDTVGYLETGYVSSVMANQNGTFETNPTLAIAFPSATTYYAVSIKFGGNPPKELKAKTYYNNTLVDTVTFDDLEQTSILFYDFDTFDKIVFEFTKGYPNNRVVVDAVTFGDFNDYVLLKDNCIDDIYGTKEQITKAISVKIYSYETKDERIVEVDDDVWYTNTINTVGQNVYVENPLIHTEEQAKDLAEWLEMYYKNNVSYDVSYRGDPRLNANDIIHVESDYLNNMQVAITEHELDFNGAFSGKLIMRRAMAEIQ